METHPDHDGGSSDAFRTVELANRILSDEDSRKHYDETGDTGERKKYAKKLTIEEEAEKLRSLADKEQQEQLQRPDPAKLWMFGDYTEFNQEQN